MVTKKYLAIPELAKLLGKSRIAVKKAVREYGKWLEVDTQEFYDFTVWVARSPAILKDEVVMGIEKFLKSHLAKLDSKN